MGRFPKMIADAENKGFHHGRRLGRLEAKLEEEVALGRRRVSDLYQKVLDSQNALYEDYRQELWRSM